MRLEIKPNTGAQVTYRQNNMKKGTTWGLDKSIPFQKSVQIRLIEVDTVASDGVYFPDETLGKLGLSDAIGEADRTGLPAIRYAPFTAHGSHYVLSYQILPNAGREFEVVSLRCITTQEKDSNGDELRLKIQVDGGSQITLSKNGVKAGTGLVSCPQGWLLHQGPPSTRRERRLRHQLPRREPGNEGGHNADHRYRNRRVHRPRARYVLTYRMTIR